MMWFNESFRRFLLDFHFPEWDSAILSRFDPKIIADNIAKAHVDNAMFFTKDAYGNCYYKTKIGHKHACIGERDIFGELVNECAKQGIKVITIYEYDDVHTSDTHPEWLMKDNEGNLYKGKLCFHSRYREFIASQLKEIAEQYDIDGFFIDMINFPSDRLACYCERCQKLFRERTGKEIPRKASWDEIWKQLLEFRYDTVKEFAEYIVHEVRSFNPSLSIVFNYHGSIDFDWRVAQRPVQHMLYDDYGTAEAYPEIWGYTYPSMETIFLRGLVEKGPFEILTSAWLWNGPHPGVVKPVEHLKWEIFTYLSNGASARIIDQPFFNGRVEEVIYDRIRDVYAEAKEKQKLFGGEFIKHVALYYSAKTRDYYGRERLDNFLLDFCGAFKSLMELHVPVDILFDETISIDKLKMYPVLYLPNTAVLTNDEEKIIREYVRNGGNLIATYDSSLCDDYGNQREDFVLNELFGANFVEKTRLEQVYCKLPSHALSQGIDPKQYLLFLGPANVVKARGKAIGDLFVPLAPARPILPNVPSTGYGPHRCVGPSIVIDKFEEGKVVYVPFRLEATYASPYAVPECKLLIRNILNNLADKPVITVDAPVNVESVITLQDDENRYVVHLIAFNAVKQSYCFQKTWSYEEKIISPIIMEYAPEYKATIHINADYSNIKVAGDSKTKVKENIVELECDRVHESVIIEKS